MAYADVADANACACAGLGWGLGLDDTAYARQRRPHSSSSSSSSSSAGVFVFGFSFVFVGRRPHPHPPPLEPDFELERPGCARVCASFRRDARAPSPLSALISPRSSNAPPHTSRPPPHTSRLIRNNRRNAQRVLLPPARAPLRRAPMPRAAPPVSLLMMPLWRRRPPQRRKLHPIPTPSLSARHRPARPLPRGRAPVAPWRRRHRVPTVP